MATIKNMIHMAAVLLAVSFCSCTKYNYIDTGLSKGDHDCTMWEYFHSQPHTWDSLILMIDNAGLRQVFDGTGEYKQITFFGLTNYSIRRTMMDHNKGLSSANANYWHSVTDIPVVKCQEIIKKLVVPQRMMLANIPRGHRTQHTEGGVTTWLETDGMTCKNIYGTALFVWTQKEDYLGVAEAGEVSLWMVSQDYKGASNERIASTDIRTTNGVVMSMNNDFRFINL